MSFPFHKSKIQSVPQWRQLVPKTRVTFLLRDYYSLVFFFSMLVTIYIVFCSVERPMFRSAIINDSSYTIWYLQCTYPAWYSRGTRPDGAVHKWPTVMRSPLRCASRPIATHRLLRAGACRPINLQHLNDIFDTSNTLIAVECKYMYFF